MIPNLGQSPVFFAGCKVSEEEYFEGVEGHPA
jgi:hypothetical protein